MYQQPANNSYVVPHYVSGGQGYGSTAVSQGQQPVYVNNQQFAPVQEQRSTNIFTLATYVQQPYPVGSNQRNTYVSADQEKEEKSGSSIANICFGLLGLIALISVILGILFAVGVIGNKGTHIDPNIKAEVNVQPNNAHLLSHTHSHTLEATVSQHLNREVPVTQVSHIEEDG